MDAQPGSDWLNMMPEQSNRISRILDAALGVEPRERSAFLASACAGDETLRRQVERLLAEDERATGINDPRSDGAGLAGGWRDGVDSAAQEPDLQGKVIQHRFAVRARLGAGGMGEVFLADDLKLKRCVALKRLPPRKRLDESYRNRLLQEARRASSVSDPHIAQVYDILEEDDETFLLMEYIEGTTLRQKIGSPLPVAEFLAIAVQCASALTAAHQKGVVHCDIKPENIMITLTGQVKILDFGIAKRLPFYNAGETTESVELQGLAGTPAYMAPEVLAGNPPDASADIYSLGVTFYEVLTGRKPTPGAFSDTAAINAVCANSPATSQGIAFTMKRMLQPDPAQRYSTAADLLRDLRSLRDSGTLGLTPAPARTGWVSRRARLALAGTLLSFVVAWIALTQLRPWIDHALHPVPEEKQVAVLPFRTAGANAETKAFADGLSEVLSAKLTQLTQRPQFQVIPASEIRAKKVETPGDARKEFGVNLVITGTWQQAGGTIHVVPVLIDAAKNRQLRADEFVAASSDPIGLETEVASGMLRMLDIELGAAEKHSLAEVGTVAPDAYAFYLRGQGYLEEFQKPENVENAISVFERALAQDPRYGLAYAGLGEAYWRKFEHTRDPVWVTKARDACEKGIDLENAGAAGHVCLGTVDNGTGKYQEASQQFQQALKLEPTNDASYVGLGTAYGGLGQLENAEKTYQRAIALRSHYAMCYNWLGVFYHQHSRFADAVRQFSQVVKISPDSYIGYSNLGGAYVDMGLYERALPILQQSIAIRPTYEAYSNLGTAYFNQGRFTEAVGSYEEAVKLNDHIFDAWGNLGDAYYWAPQMRDKAPAAYRQAIKLALNERSVNPNQASLLGYIAQYYAMLAEKALAMAYIGQALRLDPNGAETAFSAASVYNQFGDRDATVKMLKKAMQGGISAATVRSNPEFANLENELRLRGLLGGPEQNQ